ncbi:unnamed protein product [Rhizoctonia solani]|uniref:Uncharacterized protein n=1 Tax=Rhizoctonia solani TaxID=456999 RepID=A0A8H3BS07_9AGAM|nr:unnamed protein product [Rhizoctonia solani]
MAPNTIAAPAASYQPNQQNAKPYYPYITSSQPTGQRGMVMAPPSEEEREAERLRGGCIPLPAGVGSSPSLAAAKTVDYSID